VVSAVFAVAFLGCAKTTTCQVSPVELEELREDIAVLQKDLKTAKDREAQLTADLAAKKADLAAKQAKPAELRAQLDQVKRGAGKTEKAKEATTPAKPAAKPAAPKETPKTPPATPPATAPKDSTKKGSS
jgi:septal ring factor EnvC (AmiA/AmiB activator)